MADLELKSNAVSSEENRKWNENGKKDSLEHAIAELEKTLESSRGDLNDTSGTAKRIRLRCASESSERSYIVVDESNDSDQSRAITDDNSCASSYAVIDELQLDCMSMDNANFFNQSNDKVSDVTVLQKTVQKNDVTNSIEYVEEINRNCISIYDNANIEDDVTVVDNVIATCDDSSVILLDNSDCKEDKINSSNKSVNDTKATEKCNVETPVLGTSLKNHLRFHKNLKSKKTLITSTPCREENCSWVNDEDTDSNSSSHYMPPARSILTKWKPSCLQQNVDQGIEDISAIVLNSESSDTTIGECSFYPEKSIKINEFEEAFSSLYLTLFGDETNGKSSFLSNNVKLKLYHDNIVKQHEQDNIKFNEIISEISSNSNKAYISDSDSLKDEIKKDLSIISEESSESSCNKTVVENDTTVTKCDDKELIAGESDLKLNLKEIIKKADSQGMMESKINDCRKENLEVPVINGSNSIVYLNSEELILDEDDMILDDDNLDDVISLACSDIDSITPRTDISDTSVGRSVLDNLAPLVSSPVTKTSHDTITPTTEDTNISVSKPASNKLVSLVDPPINNPSYVTINAKSNNPFVTKKCILSEDKLVVTVQPETEVDKRVVIVQSETEVDKRIVTIQRQTNVDKRIVTKISEPSGIVMPCVTIKTQPSHTSNARNEIFISDNPEENEDNNHPGWEHLRRLSNDKERYKALRERWHSVVIPDPNLDLTSQMYRMHRWERMKQRGSKMARAATAGPSYAEYGCSQENFDQPSVSRKNPRSYDSSEEPPHKRRKLCTLLFEKNVESLMRRLEYKRYCIHQEMDSELMKLAVKQGEEVHQLQCNMYWPRKSFSAVYERQTREVCNLRKAYELRLKAAETETLEYVSALNAATDEVLTFHKFYQDLDSANNNSSSSMYFSDTQFNELVETERMLELYRMFYHN